MNNFIDEKSIRKTLKENKTPDNNQIQGVLKKARMLKGLSQNEAGILLNITDEENLKELSKTAKFVKDEIYGNRLVLFAPLYVSNYCNNNCLYCGFRIDNKDMHRKNLSKEEIKSETKEILSQGHKRILMLMGEDEITYSFDKFLQAIDTAYEVTDEKGSSIRRINVEIAPLTNEQFQELSKKKIGTYTVFQETYNQETYKEMHPTGKKSDYLWRLTSMDRALTNGLHDVGIGALFGLYDYKFEVLALLQHAKHLDETYGVGPHTISIPRIENASGAPAAIDIPHKVSNTDFKKLVGVLRCAVPYTGIILSTREKAELRQELFSLGVSQISAGSKTNPGGYKESKDENRDESQFSVSDTRSTGDIIKSVIKDGFIPSFCTGCYRLKRVGGDFMELAKPGAIKLHCQPNALTTLKEYLIDYADKETRNEGNELISKEIEKIPSIERKEKTKEYLTMIENGKRDLYF